MEKKTCSFAIILFPLIFSSAFAATAAQAEEITQWAGWVMKATTPSEAIVEYASMCVVNAVGNGGTLTGISNIKVVSTQQDGLVVTGNCIYQK